jgi:hypothetical protein
MNIMIPIIGLILCSITAIVSFTNRNNVLFWVMCLLAGLNIAVIILATNH